MFFHAHMFKSIWDLSQKILQKENKLQFAWEALKKHCKDFLDS